jgi:hypothetical protein
MRRTPGLPPSGKHPARPVRTAGWWGALRQLWALPVAWLPSSSKVAARRCGVPGDRRDERGRRRARRGDHPPRQHAAREPVEHDGQIDEAARHRDVGDVHPVRLGAGSISGIVKRALGRHLVRMGLQDPRPCASRPASAAIAAASALRCGQRGGRPAPAYCCRCPTQVAGDGAALRPTRRPVALCAPSARRGRRVGLARA